MAYRPHRILRWLKSRDCTVGPSVSQSHEQNACQGHASTPAGRILCDRFWNCVGRATITDCHRGQEQKQEEKLLDTNGRYSRQPAADDNIHTEVDGTAPFFKYQNDSRSHDQFQSFSSSTAFHRSLSINLNQCLTRFVAVLCRRSTAG